MLNYMRTFYIHCEPHSYNDMFASVIENGAFIWTLSEDIYLFWGFIIIFIVIFWRIGKKDKKKDDVKSQSDSDMACIFDEVDAIEPEYDENIDSSELSSDIDFNNAFNDFDLIQDVKHAITSEQLCCNDSATVEEDDPIVFDIDCLNTKEKRDDVYIQPSSPPLLSSSRRSISNARTVTRHEQPQSAAPKAEPKADPVPAKREIERRSLERDYWKRRCGTKQPNVSSTSKKSVVPKELSTTEQRQLEKRFVSVPNTQAVLPIPASTSENQRRQKPLSLSCENTIVENSDLNDQQKQAVLTTETPLLIIAGPGSGKSKTLIERTIHLIVDKKVPAENILLATFTEKAAKELITRISNRALELGVTVNISDMLIGTLHSIFLRILDEYRQYTPLKRNYRKLDAFEQQYLIYMRHERFVDVEGIDWLINSMAMSYWSSAKTISSLVDKVAEDNIDLDLLAKCNDEKLRALAEVTRIYRAILEEENAIDFSLIQTYFWNLLKNDKILEELRRRIRYIMIDEYQDTNVVQEQILLKIAAQHHRICVVGDDDQALYRFRGATVENILRFQEKFPSECQKIELFKNYRSHYDIIDFYNRWMNNTWKKGQESGSWIKDGVRYRHEKIIENAGAQTPLTAPYSGVVTVMGGNLDDWFENIYRFIEKLKVNCKISDYNQVTVLARSVKNDNITALADYLESRGIPVFSPRSGLFFERREIRIAVGALVSLFQDVLTFSDWYDEQRHHYIASYPQECLNLFARELHKEQQKHRPFLRWLSHTKEVLNDVNCNVNYSFSKLFYSFIQFPLFRDLVSVDLKSGINDLRPAYNLALFIQLVSKYEIIHRITSIQRAGLRKTVDRFFNIYLQNLYNGGLSEFEDFDMPTPSGCVSIMTIHQAKGLEFPVTCIASLGDIPRKERNDIDDAIALEYHKRKPYEPVERIKYYDFWRRYYTAFSRARNLLVLTGIDNATTRQKRERFSPSRYFQKIYKDVPSACHLLSTQIDALQIDEVPSAHIKQVYSFTEHILAYENCPVQYKFFRELNYPQVSTNAIMLGMLVHQTIEDVHREVLQGHPEHITHASIDAWLHDNYRQLRQNTGHSINESGLDVIFKHVNHYVEYAKNDWAKIRDAAVPVVMMQPNFILEGNIDLIRNEGDSIEIFNFKTEKKPDPTTKDGSELLRRYKRQLDIYANIAEKRYGLRVSRMHLFYTGTQSESPFISYDYNASEVPQAISEVANIVERIENKDFRMPATNHCQQLCAKCDLKHFCDPSSNPCDI